MDEDFFGPQPKPQVRPSLLIMLGLVILIVAGFFAWFSFNKNQTKASASAIVVNLPQPDSMADWKNFTNDKYAYSLKYPNDWFLYDIDPAKVDIQPQARLSVNEAKAANDLSFQTAFYIEVVENVDNKNVADLVKIIYPDLPPEKVKSEQVQIAGVSGYQITTTCDNYDCGNKEFLVINNGNLYHIKQNQALDAADFEKIFSNFKFTKISVVTSTLAKTKTYTNADLKFSFDYPAAWQDIVFYPVEKDALTKGSAFTTLYTAGASQPTFYDPDNIFSFSIYSNDFNNNIVSAPSPMKIDSNWTKDDFLANIKPDSWIEGYNKLGKNGLLVISHADRQCFPDYQINIYVPTNNPNFSNLIINLDTSDINKDQTIVDFMHFQSAGGQSVCNTRLPYQDITDKIMAGTYSVKMKAELDTAQKIADSFQNIK